MDINPLTFHSLEYDTLDPVPGVKSGPDPTVVLPTCLVVDADHSCNPINLAGPYKAKTTVKTENTSGANNTDETTVVVDGTTTVCGDTGAETLPESTLLT